MRRGVRVGVDLGSVRVGVAASDPDGVLASPVGTVPRKGDDPAYLDALAAVVTERAALEVVVGLPRSLSGGEGPAAVAVRECAAALADRVAPVPVRLVDERLTTVSAHRTLRDSGRPARSHRAVVDQAAAVLILQTALDAERASGRPLGDLVGGGPRPTRTGRDR